MAEKKLTGKIPRERIRMMETPPPPEGIIEGFRALAHATGIVSDVMDELGIMGVIGASVLKPTIAGARIVGPALTVRNIMQREHVYETARGHVNKMAEFEAHNLARAGGVVVIDGVPGISNMGGISAQTGERQGEARAEHLDQVVQLSVVQAALEAIAEQDGQRLPAADAVGELERRTHAP